LELLLGEDDSVFTESLLLFFSFILLGGNDNGGCGDGGSIAKLSSV